MEELAHGNLQLTLEPALPFEEKFLGEWNRLVSTTNWEKGRIICDWQSAMQAAGQAARLFSDEAWSQRVGNVSPQHVGRLRRVHERFASVYQSYSGLFWSHFFAALDWDDAEMWLEGAVQKRWSVSVMRLERWQTLSGLPEQLPREEEIVSAEWDEGDSRETREPADSRHAPADHEAAPFDDSGQVRVFDPDFGDESAAASLASDSSPRAINLADLPELPPDLADVLDRLTALILQHKMDGWTRISPAAVIGHLDRVKQLIEIA